MPGTPTRVALASDLDPIASLADRAAPERGIGGWREALAKDVGDPESLVLVAEVAGEIVGFGRARRFEHPPDPPVDVCPEGYYLTGVFVDPGSRRLGLASGLTAARLSWIAERADEAWYFANARNAASIDLHHRFGFEEVTREFSYPGLEFEGGEGILFRARLG